MVENFHCTLEMKTFFFSRSSKIIYFSQFECKFIFDFGYKNLFFSSTFTTVFIQKHIEDRVIKILSPEQWCLTASRLKKKHFFTSSKT